MTVKRVNLLILIALIAFSYACSNTYERSNLDNREYEKQSSTPNPKKLHTAYNLWFEKQEKIFSVNFKNGGIIPIGTEVKDVKLGKHRRYKTVEFHTLNPERQFLIYWNPNHHPGTTVNDFVDQLFVTTEISQLLSGLNSKEKQNVMSGTIEKGMSKEAVLLSFGPPPEKETFSISANTWTYWTSRMAKQIVKFDDQNNVSKIEKTTLGGGFMKMLKKD